jgi:carboxyl-terminal processing protease
VPDIFVPLDTVKFASSVNKIYYSGILNSFAFEYADRNRSEIVNKYRNAEGFVKNFNVNGKEMEALKKYVTEKQPQGPVVSGNEKGLAQLVKALIGRNIFDKDAYYPILNANDNAILKAVEVLDKPVMANKHP